MLTKRDFLVPQHSIVTTATPIPANAQAKAEWPDSARPRPSPKKVLSTGCRS